MDSKDQFDATFDDHLLNNHKIISEDDEDEDDKMQMVIVEDDESDDYLKHSLVGFCQVFIEEEEEKTKGNGENSENKNRSSAETNPEVLVVRQHNSVRNRKKKSSVEKVDGTNIKKLQVLSCMHCLYKTSKNGKIKSHVRKHRCKIADCRCYNAAGCDLAQHPLKRFLCTFCHDRFNTLVALARHCENRHAANNPFSCQLCDYSCSKSADLRRHSQSHRRPTVSHRYRCELCDFSSGYPGVLKRHIIAQHKDAEPYTCDLCAYDTWLGEEFEKHKILHENYEYQGPLVCEICNYQGNDCREFSRHVRTHKKDYPYSCDGFNCFFRGATPDSLKQHVKRSHRKHKLFKCSLCSFKGTSQDDLKVHVSVLHSNCDFCGQNFVDVDDLQKHVKSNLCYKGERFDEFKQHLEAHSVQFPFGCEFCLFKGATWTDLSDHLAMHKDKKPFRCDLCDFRYSDTADFDEHFKVHLNWFVKFKS